MDKLSFVFWGTPDVASETLETLKQARFLPSLIVTSPDAKKGRGMHMEASPVAIFAEQNKIPCLKPEKLDEEFCNKLKPSCLKPNCLFIVVAYGKIIPENIINMPKLGSINIHYSLLPKYRGASPVESAILNGDTETGVTIQKMVYKLDAGNILAQEKVQISPDETAPELRKKLIKIGGELLVKTLGTPSFLPLIKGEVPKVVGIEQDESQATFCKKIKKEDGLIDLNADAVTNYNKWRAYVFWPRTFFFVNGKRIIVTDAKLIDGKFVIKKIIPENGKEMNYKVT
ncbi:methionyl-tRNA formyltransferase [Candidatus Nomurabacteria bacterium RIFCSPHIGHO2_01_FULL_42_15]|uniref:Methionyl-tRNA formyltransferase n=1 Tax=Candidatus Nomurabacteria bacterium RIFCSPHIGHO2_01_FULL_42_15 TaxID=1801742 RepID=A0A1F6VFE6_9BACT|nr:MAG: methionyl-tRNA formyltransferase [Candidatus Nomurabacteria bacterium RIFCSPHIGHO2_01_FULL_42_15]OGI93203.1 MAG: methionyl-tRNA formyltransferase [Candidatus Nomurabacteria bacterium RIFCSPLOWO2_01_FULL_41_18]